MKQAVLLAGGASTRLRDRLGGRPKPLVDIDGEPLLKRQLALLREYDISHVVLLVNYGADQIRTYCAANGNFGLTIELVDDGMPRGTAGAVLAALDRLADQFLVIYGDTLLNVHLGRLWNFHRDSRADATLFVHPNDHPQDSDLVETDGEDWITAFHPYPHLPGSFLPNLVNAGLYVISRAALEPWREFAVPSDLARNLFPAMIARSARLKAYRSFEYIKDIGTPHRLDKAVAQLRAGVVARASLAHPQRAVFVDRDDTLNRNHGYVRSPEQMEPFDGVPEAVRCLNDAEYRVVVVTNQSVIARGECTIEGLGRIHSKMETQLAASGAFVDRIYFCPHHPDKGFPGEVESLKVQCECRKPGVGMIRQATAALNIDLQRSWMVGDASRDMLAAARAGLRSILVRTGEGSRDEKFEAEPDFVVDDFQAAVTFILDDYPRMAQAAHPLLEKIAPGEVVLIGGLARVGKSSFAQILASELRLSGKRAVVISLDRWIRDLELRGPGVIERFDLDLAEETLRSWLAGDVSVELELPRYDRATRRRESQKDTLRLEHDAILILEGVPALMLPLSSCRKVHRIFIASAEEPRRQRVISDLIWRGADKEGATATYIERVRDESPVVVASRATADTIIDWDAPIAGRVARA